MPTEKNLASLVINEVESTAVYEEMKRQGLLNDDELYLVTDPENTANIDQVPTAGSKNLVYSGGVYDALQQAGSADSVNEWHKGEKQRFWRGTKEEYEALAEKPEDTLFILTDDEGEAVGSGDMEAAVYDPQGKAQDVFAYVDSAVAEAKAIAESKAPMYTYGTEDVEAGSASTAATGTLHFVYE